MIDITHFELIKRKHGSYASWAVWADVADKPKSNMGDMSIFDLALNPTLLDVLKNDVIMVGLNISRSFSEPFRNFHDANPRANDFKIRYAFQNTKYYGAYMTDIIKWLEMINSNDVVRHLNAQPALIAQNVVKFREELRDLNCKAPTILAFGIRAYELLNHNLHDDEYSKLIKLTHYSHQIGKEKYRAKIISEIDPPLACHHGHLSP